MLMGRHFQNAYVTRDVDKAVAGFKERADVRKLIETEVSVEIWTPQGLGTGVQKLAFVWVEDLQVELIQPISGDVLALYRDGTPLGWGAVHADGPIAQLRASDQRAGARAGCDHPHR